MKKWTGKWLQTLGMVIFLLLAVQPAMGADGSSWGMKMTPTDKATDVSVDTQITVTFAQPVRLMNSKELTNSSWLSIIKLTDGKKKRVPFTANWGKSQRTLTIDPVGNLEAGQSFEVMIPAKKVKNDRGQANPEASVTFSTKKAVDTIAPRATIFPGHGAKQVKLTEKVTLQFAEDVFLVDGNVLASKTAGALVRLTDDTGASIAHSITWNKSKRMLTVKPRGKWQPYKNYQVELVPGLLRDGAGNINAVQRSSFTTGAK
ncbi:Ig-like domain-containing protein [Brevibacillus choshinensis]|uniref:Ig-like domain-containing protein n=1 Tax=Brevibacillus choshinensis TaxID=54911 RepID=A0ABX7FRQ5_BRECH|nr:Ig-like domain-containing protein [Brevibacillus choshinensis]QRG67675.1 Ig-like domain-containing protein [Brevibacillus choshinensis]